MCGLGKSNGRGRPIDSGRRERSRPGYPQTSQLRKHTCHRSDVFLLKPRWQRSRTGEADLLAEQSQAGQVIRSWRPLRQGTIVGLCTRRGDSKLVESLHTAKTTLRDKVVGPKVPHLGYNLAGVGRGIERRYPIDPKRPATRFAQKACLPMPIGETIPRPVTATRRRVWQWHATTPCGHFDRASE
jgi:hypothetical protein